MRTWRARGIASAVVAALVGCAAIADLQDPADSTEGSDARAPEAGPATSATATTSPIDAGAPDVAQLGDGATTKDPVQPTPETCKNPGGKKNGDSCSEPSQCCSGACDQNKQCDTSCFAIGDGTCDPNKTGECCIRSYCDPEFTIVPPNFKCRACLEKGATARTAKNIFNQTVTIVASCCSGGADPEGRCK